VTLKLALVEVMRWSYIRMFFLYGQKTIYCHCYSQSHHNKSYRRWEISILELVTVCSQLPSSDHSVTVDPLMIKTIMFSAVLFIVIT